MPLYYNGAEPGVWAHLHETGVKAVAGSFILLTRLVNLFPPMTEKIAQRIWLNQNRWVILHCPPRTGSF